MLARTLIPNAPSPNVPPVIVTPIRALMTRTIPRRDYLKHTRTLRLGQQVTPDELTRAWVDIGYEYANIVVEAGQFSRRGGILDVWSPGEPKPVRIEFFGDEIDTMRAFDPATQRTVESVEVLTIPPAREILPVAAQKAGIELQELKEFQIPLAHSMAGSMLDFLPENTLIALDGQEFISAAVMDIEEESLPAGKRPFRKVNCLKISLYPISPGQSWKTAWAAAPWWSWDIPMPRTSPGWRRPLSLDRALQANCGTSLTSWWSWNKKVRIG